MDKDTFKQPIKKSTDPDAPFGPETVASSMECTGLIPTLPMSEEEAEAYNDLYNVHKQQKDKTDPGPKNRQSHPQQ